MGMLDRDALLKKDELKVEKVELGAEDFVYVRQMTGRERDQFERTLVKEVKTAGGGTKYVQSPEDFRAKLVVNVICDETGKNLLQPSDYKILSQNMSAAKLTKIADVAGEINKISQPDEEEEVKNLEETTDEEDISESAPASDTDTPTSGSVQ